MNKTECIEFLTNLKKTVDDFEWDGQAGEYELIHDSDFLKSYFDFFKFPYDEEDIVECSILPKNLLDGVNQNDSDYQEVFKLYSKIHNLIWHKGSSETTYNCYVGWHDEAELHREYWGLVR